MHLRNSWTRSTSAWVMRQVPSGASGLRDGIIPFFTRKFQETSVTRSLMIGKACIGSIVISFLSGSELRRVMHISLGIPLISASTSHTYPPCSSSAQPDLGLRCLDLMNSVEHHHARSNLGRMVLEPASVLSPHQMRNVALANLLNFLNELPQLRDLIDPRFKPQCIVGFHSSAEARCRST